jgi:hypothetical protein
MEKKNWLLKIIGKIDVFEWLVAKWRQRQCRKYVLIQEKNLGYKSNQGKNSLEIARLIRSWGDRNEII